MKKNVLVITPVNEEHKKQLESAAPECSFTYSTSKTVTEEQVKAASAIVGNVPAKFIGASEKLELMQLNSAGTDAYIVPGVLHEDTVFVNATGAYGKAVSEHLFVTGLMLQKKLNLYRDNQKQHLWKDEGNVTSIADSTVLVVGLGDIGTHFAQMAKALGAYTIGVKRRSNSPVEGVDEVVLTEDLDKVLPRADIIASFLPGTGATAGIYTKERFDLMKPTAIFLNGGRGNAVEESVLYDALTSGAIFAAGIDVTKPEPLPETSPLWDLPNIVITPHISGGWHLPETLDRIIGIAAENLSHWVGDKKYINLVDFETGYRK